MTDFVFPEDTGTGAGQGDDNDAANFGAAYDGIGLTDFVVKGMGFTLNAGTPSLDLGSGKAVVSDSSATATQSGETRDEGVAFVVELDARTGISLTNSAVNHVFLQVDLSSDDTVNIVVNTTNSAPSEPQVKLGTVDTSNDTTTEVNRDTPLQVDGLRGDNGSNGQFLQTDGTNLSFASVQKGMTNIERQLQNDKVASIALLESKNNLSEIDYDGGFFEIFRDESKIVNSTQVALKTLDSGNAEGVAEILESLGAPNKLIETLTDSSNNIQATSLSSDFLAVGSNDNNTYVYDTTNFNLQHTLTDSSDNVNGVSLSSDFLAVGSKANVVYVYDTTNFNLQHSLFAPQDRVKSVSLSSNFLVAGTGFADQDVYVYDTTNFNLQHTLTDSTGRVNGVSLSADFLAVGSGDDNTYVYDTTNFNLQHTLTDSSDNVNGVSLSSDFLAVGGGGFDRDVYVYDTTNFNLQHTLTDSSDSVNGVSLNADFLAVGSSDDNTYVYDTTNFDLQDTLTDSSDNVNGVSLVGEYLAVGSSDDNAYVYERSLLFADSGTIEWSKDLSQDGFSNPPSNVVTSWNVTLPSNTSISIEIADGSGNSVNLSKSDIDSEVDLSPLTSTTLDITVTLSQSSTNDDVTPTLNDLMLNFQK
jgi:hypothetical protein